MDQEIAYAVRGGLDYWAFVTYDPDDPMSLGLQRYLMSARRADIRFCLITEHSRWGTRADYRKRISRFVDLMGKESYQTVLDRRPLLYLGFIQDAGMEQRWGTIDEFRKAVDDLREMVRNKYSRNPYIVLMDFDPQRGHKLRKQLGADAITTYAAQGNGTSAPYSTLAEYAETFWERCAATGSSVVPIVISGWDRRPRVEHPVPWETWQKPGVGIDRFYERPTPEEFASHLQRALAWMRRNARPTPASTALIYAWNENDEGGWLVPTISEGTARIDAVAAVLRRQE